MPTTYREIHTDPSDRYDLDREREVTPFDYTADLPPIPGTTDVHPLDCRCIPCVAEQHYLDSIPMCECELDWRCPACGPGPSPIERINDEWASRENAPWWAQ